MRTAFYPCCGVDFLYPAKLLADFVEKIIFCDVNPASSREFRTHKGRIGSVDVELIVGDVRDVVNQIGRIDVFFYRGDSRGEGGSGVYVLAKKFFSGISAHFGDEALIITDGRNSGDELFKRMIRPSGYSWLGRHYHLKDGMHQPNAEGLYTIQVKPVTGITYDGLQC